jgi:hypothetical protein
MIELFVQKRQNTDYTLKMVILRVKIEILNLFFTPFSIDKTKWLNILDLAMVSQSLSFEAIKSRKKKFSAAA